MTGEFGKQVSETDVYVFAAISQDFSPMHVDEPFAARTAAGGRIGHGVLTLAILAEADRRERGDHPAGYSRVRFTKPVKLGDTVTAGPDPAAEGTTVARNQADEVVAVAERVEVPASAADPTLPAASDAVWISRTVSAADASFYRFAAGASSGLADLDEEAADRSVPPEFVVGLMSGASTLWCDRNGREDAFSYGYDDIVFHRPLAAGDTLRVGYRVVAERPEEHKLFSRAEAIDEDGALVASATHILWHAPADA